MADENYTSCSVVNENVHGLHFGNTCSTVSCKITKESFCHIGIQTNLCSETCQPKTICKTVSITCEQVLQSCPNENIQCYPQTCDAIKCTLEKCQSNNSCTILCPCKSPQKTASQSDCPSDDCSNSGESKTTTTCDCISFFIEKENLQCQLTESKQLLEQCKMDAKKTICEAEEKHKQNELEMNKCLDRTKLLYKKNINEITEQLKACQATISCKEKDLKCCRERGIILILI